MRRFDIKRGNSHNLSAWRSTCCLLPIELPAGFTTFLQSTGEKMKLVLQIITVWVMLSSCIIILTLTWAYFRAERRARRHEAQRAADWLISTGLRPPS
jgi:hypothetical protein